MNVSNQANVFLMFEIYFCMFHCQPSPVRLELKIRNTLLDEFMSQEGIFLTAVKNLLSNHGYGDVQANVHSITQDEHLV